MLRTLHTHNTLQSAAAENRANSIKEGGPPTSALYYGGGGPSSITIARLLHVRVKHVEKIGITHILVLKLGCQN